MSIINTALIGKLKKIKADKTNVLELDNNTEYTPITDYNPTTKKYVDDEIAATNRIYMNGRSVEDFTATAGQNTFTTSSSLGLDTEVFYNGIKLDSSDYAVGANDITLIEAAELGDLIQVITYGEIGSLEINYTRSAYTVGTPLNSYDGNLNTFPAVYVVGNVDVFLNGLKLNPAEFTGTNGSTIVLVEDADIDDKIEITSGLPVTGSNYYNKTEVDALVLPATDQGAGNFLSGDGTYKAVTVPTNVSELTNDSGYITANQSITLTGDVSGSGTTSINVTIADDSHNHTIANVDGLQDALNAIDTNPFQTFSESANGYVRFDNGFTMAWAEGAFTGSEIDITITFPVTFSTVYRVILGTTELTGGRDGMYQLKSFNTSSATAHLNIFNSGGGSAAPHILVIGKIN